MRHEAPDNDPCLPTCGTNFINTMLELKQEGNMCHLPRLRELYVNIYNSVAISKILIVIFIIKNRSVRRDTIHKAPLKAYRKKKKTD